ncbi:ribosomal protein L23 [Chloropicon primus]|uniref:Large ribosomal subunit protein uL23c n=1 Tax=Chloropicon primus TaxID=1764295 RepID=A0A5B8MXC0_9CHLO|nr:ribosomal protein L23 [Chloropicon primus]UPR04644.1 ribosomal protein L23 [Chloropicon primus]|mmetsp:Transcript_12029/g.33301  ORF Transcript_12029/g.33301 Transcript_12029/m.33301 type:complete len:110 (-) Transcript_12029:761-1090(-)|eukprot:QDZ25448.1 ribosomal protein L23 [Chloropicon primus]
MSALKKVIPGTRLPIYFPNMVLQAMPLSEEGLEAVSKGEMPSMLKFRSAPSVGKLEIKNYLRTIYGLDVKRVHTANYQGKKKQLRLKNKVVYYRKPDFKSITVELNQNR